MIETGTYIWDKARGHVGVVDDCHPDGVLHYRVHEIGNERPHGYWTNEVEVEVLTGPIPADDSTIMDRLIWDLLESNPTFHTDPLTGDITWSDRDGTCYRVEVRLPGLSVEQVEWTGGSQRNA